MKMVDVQSSNLASVGFDPDRRELRVAFKSGHVVEHSGVPIEEHSRLMAADSHGGHYYKHIQKQYPHRKMPGQPTVIPTNTLPQEARADADRRLAASYQQSSIPVQQRPASNLDEAIRRYVGETEE